MSIRVIRGEGLPLNVPSPAQLSALLHQRGSELGFELVGITPAVPAPGFPHLVDWLERGFAGEMDYIPRRQAAYAHPSGVMPGVRSIVMVARSYFTRPGSPSPEATTPSPAAPALVAQYARGPADYHDTLRLQLRELAATLHAASPECRSRITVDTAPLLERDYARLAGLGWFGKNTLLINRKAGSFLFLGALLTDADLAADTPHHTTHCGTCTRCLDACPTDAFAVPYVLDATRCIAYLTIEQRGPIPAELRAGVGSWVFGCDVCQDVCPWNRKAPGGTDPAYAALSALNPADALELLALTPAQFTERFAKSPISRAGYNGLRRNAAIVVGNLRAQAAWPVLCPLLSDPSPIVRGAAAWALGQLGTARDSGARIDPSGQGTAAVLQAQLANEDNPEVQLELTSALARLHPATSGDSPCPN